jgi:hypothetical protein
VERVNWGNGTDTLGLSTLVSEAVGIDGRSELVAPPERHD